ncbi:hypothetical protein SEA_LITTLETOKYO_22 [Arthrobacter phage LittleTokyo]|nr:hypothetical protein SEA_LITTLETOKYO_22 [Arthrobacter phage LittleTokyo]
MTPELLTAILGAGGLSYIVPKAIDGLKAWKSGRAREEKEKNKGLVDRLAVAESRLDAEAVYRRQVEEHAAVLRRLLIEVYGLSQELLPPWPVRKK